MRRSVKSSSTFSANLRLLRKLTAGDKQVLFYGWCKSGQKEAKGGNEKIKDLIVSSDQTCAACDASS